MKRKLPNKNNKAYKEKSLGLFSSISGSLSFLGGWQVCHNLCLGIIAMLSVIGITVVGMPLLFLTQYAVYFWSAAVLLLVPTLIMYRKNRKCISVKLVLFNVGIVIASVPFADMQSYQILFWTVGAILIASSVWMFVKPKFQRNNKNLASGAFQRPDKKIPRFGSQCFLQVLSAYTNAAIARRAYSASAA